MPRLVRLGALLFVFVVALNLQASDRVPTVFRIDSPTIIAFFPITQKDAKSGDTNEALSDFQLYLAQSQTRLQQKGIDLKVTYAEIFRVSTGGETKLFRPEARQDGYYFIAPGKQPHFEYGVMTDSDLLEAADRYFGDLKK